MAEPKKLGRYELRRVLGKGAMGVVYDGYDPTLGRQVAIKTILKSVALDEETERSYGERFVREAKAVARLSHPNIIQVHDFGVENDVAYLVMEFIRGRELRACFESKERFDIAETVRVMGELLDALEFAHEAGVIHRDVKPANVMLDAQRRVKLADFGVARIQDSDRSAAGTMVGTPAFMSPEQIQGLKIDRRTDIFSAGVILYQLLTGEQPFTGEGAWTVARKIMQEHPPAPSSVVRSVSPAFDAIVERALAKSPADRFANAREFAFALRASLGAGPPVVGSLPSRPKAKAEVRATEAEVEFWRSIQNSTDPAEFETYLEAFPQGTYAQLARLKIGKLREPAGSARKTAEEKARLETETKARQEAEEKARREAIDKSKRDADDKARREAAAKAKREAEEKERKAQAFARSKQQEQAAARSKAAADGDATVAIGGGKGASAPPPAERKTSYVIPAVVAAVVIVGAAGAYMTLGRKSAPAPVAEAPAPVSAPAPKPEVTAADIEKIKKETEERIRREYADKSAAEQAAAAKAATEKAVQEKQAALKVAAEKAAAEKAAADKLAAEKAQAEKLAAAKSVAERAALEKAAADKAAAEKATSEKAADEKAAAEKLAAEKAAADKAAAAKAAAAKPGWPSVGDRWVYEARDVDWPDKKYQVTVEVQNVTPVGIRDLTRVQGSEAVTWTHTATPQVVGLTPGIASFNPYLRAFHDPQASVRWSDFDFQRLWSCGTVLICNVDARVAGKEQVTVRAGSYETWKIVVALRAARIANGEFTFWYSDALKRTVKYQFRSNYFGSTAGISYWSVPNIDMELVSYAPAGTK